MLYLDILLSVQKVMSKHAHDYISALYKLSQGHSLPIMYCNDHLPSMHLHTITTIYINTKEVKVYIGH